MKALLFGAQSDALRDHFAEYKEFDIVDADPDIVVCYGGDGTLLTAERQWPCVPKVPIRNSRGGNRCIPHPPEEVIKRLVEGGLNRTEFMRLECRIRHGDDSAEPRVLDAMNEINVHMGRINTAVRFTVWIDDEPYLDGAEIIGDGLVLSTPFGSTAYFNQITRGVFYAGMGIAYKNTSEHTSHVVTPDTATVRVLITRGPAILAFDNSSEYIDLTKDDEILVRKHPRPATIFTWDPMSHPSDAF